MRSVRTQPSPGKEFVALSRRRLSVAQPASVTSEFDGSLSQDLSGEAFDATVGIGVRSARFGDLPTLARMQHVITLNQPEIQLGGYSVTRAALAAMTPGGGARPRLFVACVEDRVVGFAQFQPAYSDRRWHAVAVGSSTGVYDASPVEDVLVRHGITAAGLRGVKRLFARIPSGTDLVETFGQSGFSPYATETIFVSDSAVSLDAPHVARRQEQTDTWAIHQLYNATAPRTVQYAEAVTSHRWDLRGADELAHGARRNGWLIDDGHLVAAYARVSHGRRASSLELLYLPDTNEALCGLIDTVLRDLRQTSRNRRVFCTLRGYQVEAAKVLEERGFEPVLEQDLHVKYTTASVRAPQPEPISLHAEVIERLPKRVPSFLQQGSHDGNAGCS
jgi:hypothetical protein